MKYNTLAFTISLILSSQMANANPAGGQVVHGTATFSNPSVNVLNVTNSNNAIINWQSFNIGAGQTTNFIQPSSASSVLNRVISNNPSQLLGNLNSNGKVFLINQNGILVGAGAQINTAGFFGSTLNITDNDYLNGNLKFEGDSTAGISNQGYIHAGDNGNIVLIAANIENGGVIEVENGNVILAAGQSITISSLENPAIQFEVTGSENSVTNLGKILANQGSASLFAGTLRHSGLIRAGGLVQNADGSISLVAKNSNQVSGEVDVSGSKGGYIEILGETVGIESGANINASGDTAGGEILIGGDRQGLNPEITNARSTTIAEGVIVNADANTEGNGGKVIVFAKEDVHVHGNVSARGGAVSGDGGFIETSGLLSLDITSVPDASAVNGEAGEWLIDPNNIYIWSGSGPNMSGTQDFVSTNDNAFLDVSLINLALEKGQNVTVTTGTAGTNNEAGDITILTDITSLSNSDVSLTLNAHNDIIFDADATPSNISVSAKGAGALDLILNPNQGSGSGQVIFNTLDSNTSFNVILATNGGSLTVNGDTAITGGGSLMLQNTNWDVQQGHSVNIQFATLDLDATSALNNDGDINMDNADITGTGQFNNKGDINLKGTDTSLSIIDTANLNFSNSGWIDIQDNNTLTLTAGVLDLGVGSGLSSSGNATINSDVTVDGGVIVGGDGVGSPGILTITGDLVFKSGALYAVLDAPDGIRSSYVSADKVVIDGGSLILNWLDSTQAASANGFAGSITSVVGCSTGIGCLDTSGSASLLGFDTIVDPIATTTKGSISNVLSTNDESVSYTIGSRNTSNIYQWTGLSSASPTSWSDPNNWMDVFTGTTVVTAPDSNTDVFIDGTITPVIDINSAANVRGIQSHGQIKVGSGGSLDVSGNAFILSPDNDNGGLAISAADAKVSRTGAGVLYNLGATLKLDQGILSADTVNWGEIQTSVGTAFQIDGNLVNNALFALDASTGANTFTGTGSIDNKGIMSWANGAKLTLTDGVSLSSASSNAQFLGAGLLSLQNTSEFKVDIRPQVYDTTIDLELIDGVVSGIQNIPSLPIVTMSGASEIRGEGDLVIDKKFTVDGGSFYGTSITNPLLAKVKSSVQVLQNKTLILNNTDMLINSASSLTGAGEILISPNSNLIHNSGGLIQIARINLAGGSFTANSLNYAGNLVWDGGIINGSGLTTSGLVNLTSGRLDTDWSIAPNGTVNWDSPSYAELQVNNKTITNEGLFTIKSLATGSQTIGSKGFSSSTAATLINKGTLVIDSNPDADPNTADVITFDESNISFINDAGTIAIKSGTFEILGDQGFAKDLVLDQSGDTLTGSGTFKGNVVNKAGTVSPGEYDLSKSSFSTGSLTITGNYTQQTGGSLVMKLAATKTGMLHDTLNVGGELTAGGKIGFKLINNSSALAVASLLGQSFTPLTYSSFTPGSRFDRVEVPFGLKFTFSDNWDINITSNSLVLNEISNQLETLFDNEELDHHQMVEVMKFTDRTESVDTSDEEEDDKKKAPRLVCK